MKKDYLTPQMEIDYFEEEDILCYSGGGNGSDGSLEETDVDLDD